MKKLMKFFFILLMICCLRPVLSCKGAEEPDTLFYPYYGTLSESGKAVYCQILDAALNGILQIEPSVSVTSGEMSDIVKALYLDQPGLFWMTGAFECQYLPAGDDREETVTSLTLSGNGLEADWENTNDTFAARTREFLDGLEGLSPSEKEMEIHNRLASGVHYVSGSLCNQSAYSAVCLGESVCAGYARAFQYLMTCAGIPCYYCDGTAIGNAYTGNSSWNDHAWNIVCLSGSFYNVDLTWDDTSLSDLDVISYTYYNQPDSVFEQNHIRGESASAFLPSCTDTEYTYESLYGIPAQLGVLSQLDASDAPILTTLDDYFSFIRDFMISCGTGEHTARFVISQEECYQQVAAALDTSDFPYLEDVAAALGLNGYEFSVSQHSWQLGDGYYLITQTVILN